MAKKSGYSKPKKNKKPKKQSLLLRLLGAGKQSKNKGTKGKAGSYFMNKKTKRSRLDAASE